jgi:hypothetical protein
VVPALYRDLFGVVAGASAALTGLLFVALSVTLRRDPDVGPGVIQQVRAAAALLAFINALAVSLFGLVPGTNVGYPAVVLGVTGIAFTAAAIRSVLGSSATSGQQVRQLGLVILLLLIFGTELAGGAALLADPASGTSAQVIGYALVASVLVGVARAWELVGERDTGLFASIVTLAGHPRAPRDRVAARAGAADDAPVSEHLPSEAGE